MELNSLEVLRVLQSKKVEWLNHANTVRTICTFFRDGHILARGITHERGLDQTGQLTDTKDRQLGIWYDLFFDASDIHQQMNGRNYYGPILLRFDLKLLEQDWLPSVWITKSNPIHWTVETPANERWFTSIEELESNYSATELGQHIVLRNVAGSVRLFPYLREVVIDNPKRRRPKIETDLLGELLGALRSSMRIGKMLREGVNYTIRPCVNCRCAEQYQKMKIETAIELFGA